MRNPASRELKVESEKSMEPENTSNSSRPSQYSQTHCADMVSKMRVSGVQNGEIEF